MLLQAGTNTLGDDFEIFQDENQDAGPTINQHFAKQVVYFVSLNSLLDRHVNVNL